MQPNLLETRTIFVHKEPHTRGHVFPAMLTLKVARECDSGLKEAFGTRGRNAQALPLKHTPGALSRLYFQRPETTGQKVLQLSGLDPRQETISTAIGGLVSQAHPAAPCAAVGKHLFLQHKTFVA